MTNQPPTGERAEPKCGHGYVDGKAGGCPECAKPLTENERAVLSAFLRVWDRKEPRS